MTSDLLELKENLEQMEYEIDIEQIQAELFNKQILSYCDDLDKIILLDLYFNN